MEKRAASSHRGIHTKLQGEPKVRLSAAQTAALSVGNKRPKGGLDSQKERPSAFFALHEPPENC